MKRLSILTLLILIFVNVVFAGKASASEGNFNLQSMTGQDYRCYASSVFLSDRKYHMLVTCRNLVFSQGEDIAHYILWARSAEGENIKLGNIGLGKASFTSQQPFSTLFITQEIDPNVGTPEGALVMQGGVESIEFLQTAEESAEETPVLTPTPIIDEEEMEEATGIGAGLRRAGLATALAFVAILALIFIITRPR